MPSVSHTRRFEAEALSSRQLSTKCVAKVGLNAPVIVVAFAEEACGSWSYNATPIEKHSSWVHSVVVFPPHSNVSDVPLDFSVHTSRGAVADVGYERSG